MASRHTIQLPIVLCLALIGSAAIGHAAPAVAPLPADVAASERANPAPEANAPQGDGTTTANEWTWMGGSSTISGCVQYEACGQPGVYGTLGTFAAANIPGGRYAPAAWTDSSGHFWMFGGNGYDSTGNYSELNDLWEFNASTNQWAWKGGSKTIPTCPATHECGESGVYGTLGVAAAGNIPGSRYSAATWTDGSGNFWLFGGTGQDSAGNYGLLNDLWEFEPSTGEWTWKGGSKILTGTGEIDSQGQPGVYGTLGTPSASNIPGARKNASTWVEGGNLWLFGGNDIDKLGNDDPLNDLWEFNPSSNEWTWVSGFNESRISGIFGVYGTLGEAAAGNFPGARQGAISWTDSSDNLWLFGGVSWDANDVGAPLNDLWEFDPSTKEWTWQGGSSAVTSYGLPQPGVYGVLGAFAAANVPSGRSESFGWSSGGNFWFFGGDEEDNYLNDLWEFNTSTKEWAWIGGNYPTCDICTQNGVYGTLGTPNAANLPGGREQIASWIDTSGNVWLFGGMGNDSAGNLGYLNDMWEYRAVTSPPATTTPTVTVAPSPTSITAADALTVTVTVSGGTGKPVPTGSITLAGGGFGFVSAVTAMSAGIATIDIKAGNLLPAVDILTAYYTPDAASAATYNGAKGSGTVDVAATTAATAANVSVLPLEYGIWTTQTLPVQIHVYGSGSSYPVTGSVTLKGGSFTSAATVLGGGIANIDIPGSSLAAGTDTLTATYTPDANSVESFSSASGTASVVVSVQPENQPEWAWMGGDNLIPGYNDQGGVYGVLGAASPTNYPGGRINFTSWTDSSGNFWIFGGEGNDGVNNHVLLNDLWKFEPSTQEWTWVSGTSVYPENSTTGGNDAPGVYGTEGKFAAANVPGSRIGASSWIDASGHLWMYGGYGFIAGTTSGPLTDLWEFDPSTSEWAWMAGSEFVVFQQAGEPGVYGTLGVAAPGNYPAARQNASTWIDKSGNLWLFGGYPQDELPSGCYSSSLNDMWRFSPSNMEWAWMGGSEPYSGQEFCEDGPPPPPGVYGTLGTPAAGNIPGGRDSSATWTDSSGNLWLFGGGIIYDSYGDGTYNDLWEFSPTTNEWTWMGGSNTVTTYTHTFESNSIGREGVYGTLGTASTTNIPGSRTGALTWVDGSGKFWLFGGGGLDSNGVPGELNDLWEFNPSTKEWTWMGGTSAFPPIFAFDGPVGIYGTLGEPAAANTPGGRGDGASFTDKSGNLWLFGGESWDAVGQNGWFNDLWKYDLGGSTPEKITPTVTVTPSLSTITTLQVLSVTIDVSGGTGNPTPAGTVTLAGGGYTSAATTLSSGSAVIGIAAGSLAAGADTLTATYTPSSGSSTTYNSAMGSAQVTVNKIAQTIAFTQPTSPVAYPVSPITLSATGGASGNPVTFSVVSGPGTVSGTNDDLLTVTGPGTIVVAANQAGNATYAAAAQVERSVVVTGSGTPATMSSPTAGSTLGTSNVKFTWTAGAGVTDYELWLGTSGPGSSGLYSSGLTTALSATVATIPAKGSMVYARLFSVIAGKSQYIDYTYTETVAGVPATMSSPTAGSTLGASNVKFTWTAGTGVTDYELWLGTSGAGSSGLYSSGLTTATTATVTAIPAKGLTVYARLFSVIGGKSQYNDYTYTETAAGVPAAMSSPASGSTLGTSNVKFTWTAGTGVTDYELWLGTSGPGSSGLYSSGLTTATTATVTTIPAKGLTVYARLFSTIGGKSQYNDYTYTETAAGVPATMSSPTSGSTLGTSNVQFTWTAGTGVTSYELWLGTSAPGSSSLYSSGLTTSTSATVTTLPAKGLTVYARLFSIIGGKSQYNDYTYTEQ